MSVDDDVYTQFKKAVNMTAKQLEKWLETDESKKVGQSKGGGESTGHKSGRRIVELLGTKKADLTESDEKHMKKVISYVERHSKQRPDKSTKEIEESRWRYSLMNWGNDPLKK